MNRRRTLFEVLLCTPVCLAGDIYFITGAPTPKVDITYPSRLYSVSDRGDLALATELVPKEGGLEWISINHDWRKAVLLEKSTFRLTVLNFDSLSAKACKLPQTPGSLILQVLIDSPGKGPAFFWHTEGGPLDNPIRWFHELPLDFSEPCASADLESDAADIRFAVAHGAGGTGESSSWDGVGAGHLPSGALATKFGGRLIEFPHILPEEFRSSRRFSAWIAAHNSQLLVVKLSEVGGERSFLFFDKATRHWTKLPPELSTDHLRVFGGVIAGSVTIPTKLTTKRSPGRGRWRKERTESGPPFLYPDSHHDDVYSGELVILDTKTAQKYSISTDQADSEVLLIEKVALTIGQPTSCTPRR